MSTPAMPARRRHAIVGPPLPVWIQSERTPPARTPPRATVPDRPSPGTAAARRAR